MGWGFYNAAGILKTGSGRELVSALPSSPVDGQEIFYQSAGMATDGLVWHLRYRAASASSYKWEFLGGSSLFSAVTTDQSTTSTTYTDLTTAGPSVTLPLAGDYDVTHGFRGYNNTNGSWIVMSYAIGGTAAADADYAMVYMFTAAVGGAYRVERTIRKTGLTAVTLTAKYKVSGGTGYAEYRQLEARPIRVG